jgi:hypothetical protein
MASPPSGLGSSVPSHSAIKTLPSGTVTMASLGFTNGPADRVLLPVGSWRR